MLYELILINEIEQRAKIIFLSACHTLCGEVQDIEPMHVWRPHEIKMDPTCAVGLTQRFVSACYSKLLFRVFNL